MKIYRLGKHAPTLKRKTLKIGDFLNLSVLPHPAGRVRLVNDRGQAPHLRHGRQ